LHAILRITPLKCASRPRSVLVVVEECNTAKALAEQDYWRMTANPEQSRSRHPDHTGKAIQIAGLPTTQQANAQLLLFRYD
jgi:hypothetical protein